MNVFVYGSLKNGYGNNVLLMDSEFVQKDKTASNVWDLRCWGGFPAAYKSGSDQIQGELYKVDLSTMRSLDSLEGFPHFYNREEVLLESGQTAWIYFIDEHKEDKTGEYCPNGIWPIGEEL